jgi:O-antigen biosynthesis protein WbqP
MLKRSSASSEAFALMGVAFKMYRHFLKPICDVVISFTLILCLSPIMIIAALAILIEDGRPLFFVHERIGRDGALFKIYKFRSMKSGTAVLPSSTATDFRITRVGSILRRLNVDELPQLLNVIKLQMSMIGPRPGLPSQADLHEARRANGAIALRPGITGLAQVKSYNGMTTQAKAACDGEYACQLSLWLDVQIVFLTVRYLLKPPPVY